MSEERVTVERPRWKEILAMTPLGIFLVAAFLIGVLGVLFFFDVALHGWPQ